MSRLAPCCTRFRRGAQLSPKGLGDKGGKTRGRARSELQSLQGREEPAGGSDDLQEASLCRAAIPEDSEVSSLPRRTGQDARLLRPETSDFEVLGAD